MKREMDWNDLRYFLAVARLGRLSPAARRLGVEHRTAARRIDGLERTMGTRLFDRCPEGLALTEAGQALLPMTEDGNG